MDSDEGTRDFWRLIIAFLVPPLGLGRERREPAVRGVDDQRGAPRRCAPVPPELVVGKGQVALGCELGPALGRGTHGLTLVL